MKSIILLLFVFLKFAFVGLSQENIIEDELSIKFEGNDGKERMMDNKSDFCYYILQENLSQSVKRVYTRLIWDDTASRFANYYWELYKKVGSRFVLVTPPNRSKEVGFLASDLHMQYGNKGDSIFATYDIEKKELLPFKTDTLCFNLLYDQERFEPGQYKFRVHLRIGNAYSIKGNKREISDMYYVGSGWYYFRILNGIKGSRPISKKEDCECQMRFIANTSAFLQ